MNTAAANSAGRLFAFTEECMKLTAIGNGEILTAFAWLLGSATALVLALVVLLVVWSWQGSAIGGVLSNAWKFVASSGSAAWSAIAKLFKRG